MNYLNYIADNIKTDYKLIQKKKKLEKLSSEILKIADSKTKAKHKIYEEIREEKIKGNKLISIDGIEIKLEKKKLTRFSKILSILPFSSKSQNIEIDYKALYFGYGNVAKFIDIPKIENDIINIHDSKKIHGLLDYDKTDIKKNSGKKENSDYFMEGKKLVWISKDCIINPKFNNESGEFIYDITPEYYYGFINNVMDWALTRPKTEPVSLMGAIKKYGIFIALAAGLYLLQKSQGQP